VSAGQRFLVVADGIKGETGVLRINWLIGDPAKPGSLPPPPNVRVNEGEATSLPAVEDCQHQCGTTALLPVVSGRASNPERHQSGAGSARPERTRCWSVLRGDHNSLRHHHELCSDCEVKIPFSLVGLPDRLHDGIFDLQVSGTPGDPFALQSTPDLFNWTDLAVGTLPGYPSRSVTQTPGSTLSGSIASPRLRRRSDEAFQNLPLSTKQLCSRRTMKVQRQHLGS
jgi:hypothetical protein